MPPAPAGSAPPERYELVIENTNRGQNFSPPVIVLHRAGYRMFEVGEPPSVALWRVAEDGSTTEFQALRDPDIDRVMVGRSVHRRRSPVFTTIFEAPADRVISLIAMLTLTNDGFIAARAVELPAAVGASVAAPLRAYDAGSEANTESCEHVPCEVHGRRMTEGAEGVVRPHAGIRGDGDIALSRGWQGPDLGRLTITLLPQEDAS
ncbi:MAG: spondin domain-containing protein [Geminicoccaceae bacterium]|nr:spondin domain-containing protein [Geminicoccaceae bacterium]